MIRFFIVILLLLSTAAHAGGSFTVAIEFSPIKQQIPALWKSLNQAFDLETSGSANMIGSKVNERLGHRRVGPYCLAGKPKGQNGSNTLRFCFITEHLWLDGAGETSSLDEASDVRERFVALEITPLVNGSKP